MYRHLDKTRYRPEGFNADKIRSHVLKVCPLDIDSLQGHEMLIEAGADAMLEGLLRSNEPFCEVYEATVTSITGEPVGPVKAYGREYPGKWVFIPEEKG